MYKTIGVLAHVDAGKTTLSEQLLLSGGVIRTAGRVDNGTAFLDFDATEQRRGITIDAGQASFRYGEHTYFLLDTPGHADFSAEMERTLQALDYAVLVVSCVEGVQAHTEVIWKLLTHYRLPTFFFLNKTDRDGADVDRTMRQIRTLLTPDALLLDDDLSAASQALAEMDERLLDAWFNGGFDHSIWRPICAEMVHERNLFPCCSGSALHGDGVDRLLSLLDQLSDTRYDPNLPLAARCWQVRHDASGGRLAFLKLTGGILRVKDPIGEQKIHEIRMYQGGKYTSVAQVEAGQVCAVTGTDIACGEVIGSGERRTPTMTPLLQSAVLPQDGVPVQRVLDALRILEAESPELRVHAPSSGRPIRLDSMGDMQLEVLCERMQARFGLPIIITDSDVLYQETIVGASYGCGHFEPLRHYAEVHVLLRALPRGTGVRFASACPTDVLRMNWQRLIETHVYEKTHVGALCGFPVTDVEVILLTGRAHEKHTEGGDFRQATYRAIRNALFYAHSEILEPYVRFTMRIPMTCIGRILSDMQQLCAAYDAPITEETDAVLTGRCPASEMMRYRHTFSALTKGRGVLHVQFDGYDVCHDPQDVMERHPYDRTADTDNPADSVFCSHGAGYTVKWDEARAHMHCDVPDTHAFDNSAL